MLPIKFDEDSFDLDEHKKAVDAIVQEKARNKRIRRNIKIGKILLAITAPIIAVLLYYTVSLIVF